MTTMASMSIKSPMVAPSPTKVKERAARRKKTVLPLEYLEPEDVINVAYCAYYIDAHREDSVGAVHKSAQQAVVWFQEECDRASIGSAERKFLLALQGIIVSLARGIARCKRDERERREEALEEKTRRSRQLTFAVTQMGMLKFAWRVLLLAGLGFSFSQTIVPGLQTKRNIDPDMFSMLFTTGTLVVAGIVKSIYNAWKTGQLHYRFEHELLKAEQEYSRRVLKEYMRAREDAARAWQDYTGKKPRAWIGREVIMAEDIKTHELYMEEQREIMKHPLARMALQCQRVFGFLRSQWKKRRG